ncbi:Rim9p [Rhodotorula paludigena]|uniref:Rim9p n=1 Tax=Rhodotorula paludigena TaxID=86838 RepID=UPI0031748AD0
MASLPHLPLRRILSHPLSSATMLGFHHFGTFLLFCATVLLIVSSITSPVVNDIPIIRATIGGSGSSLRANFGVFGYCLTQDGQNDACTGTQVGYELPAALAQIASSTGILSDDAQSAIRAVTAALILHPIACGVSFFAFLIAACSDRLGFICASLIAILAAILALIAMILDLILVIFVRHWFEDNNLDGLVDVDYSYGTWTTVAAFACLFVAVFATLCACIRDRRQRRYKY